jgi:hypothetical protein
VTFPPPPCPAVHTQIQADPTQVHPQAQVQVVGPAPSELMYAVRLQQAVVAAVPILAPCSGCSLKRLRVRALELWPVPVAPRLQPLLVVLWRLGHVGSFWELP